MSKSKIEWTERTWNPTVGCNKVSEGCRNCYALTMSARIANAAQAKEVQGKEPTETEEAYMRTVKHDGDKYIPKWTGDIAVIEERITQPLQWQKPSIVFVDSMTDLFHTSIPYETIDLVFCIMALAHQHTFQILTKRPDRMRSYLKRLESRENWRDLLGWSYTYFRSKYSGQPIYNPDGVYDHLDAIKWPLPNVWLGTSIENQDAADDRLLALIDCPATVRFLSCEPLLGKINLGLPGIVPKTVTDQYQPIYTLLHWVIVGGESGFNARPMHPEWVRGLRDQCVEGDVPFFFKQWGNCLPEGQENSMSPDAWSGVDADGIPPRYNPDTGGDLKIWKFQHKKDAGRLLDGQEWNQIPEVEYEDE